MGFWILDFGFCLKRMTKWWGLSPERHGFFLHKLNSLFCLILSGCWMEMLHIC